MPFAAVSSPRLNAASLGALLDAVGDAVWVFDARAAIVFANRAARAQPGAGHAQRLDELAATLGDDALAWLHRLRGTAPPQPATHTLNRADGRTLTLELSRLPGGLWSLLARGGTPAPARAPTSSAATDATADDMRPWFDLSPVGMVVFAADGRLLRANAAFAALVGDVPATLDDADPALRGLLGGGDTLPLDATVERQASLLLADGSRRRLLARLRAVELSPGRRRLFAVVEDRSAEDERELAQHEIGALMDTAGVGVATFDESRGWLRASAPRASAAGGAGGGQGGVQAISRDLVEPGSLPEYERLQRALKGGERAQVRYAVRHPELGLRWLLTRAEPARLASGRRAVSVVTLDITEQERSREQLLLQAERTRAVLDSVQVGIVTVAGGVIEWMNRSARRMFGGEPGDFAGRPIAVVATDEADHPLRRADWPSQLGEGGSETFECRLQARDGRTFWVVGNVVATGAQLTFALLDIERRRQAELHSARTQASLERIVETAPLAIALVDATSLRVLQINHRAADLLGCALDAALGRPIDGLFGDDGAALRDDLVQAARTHEPTRRELRRTAAAGGEARIWELRCVSLPAADDPAGSQLLLVGNDVTEQRVAEAARLQEAIAQRDMLVREVHHRIKNNLQGVAGLMQQIAARRPEVAPVIKEAVGQVQAIAQVYGLQVGVAGPLRVKSVLESIAASVQRMFGCTITVEVCCTDVHRWALPEAESIPIALTVNELLTNAVKHGSGGAVHASLHCGEQGLEIVVANPGRLPEGFDLARVPGGVSGLGLVRALLPRRHAKLTMTSVDGEVKARIALSSPVVSHLEPL